MNTYGVDLMGRRRWRRHSAEFKAGVIEECLEPSVSIAAVAVAHGLNANMLSKWGIDGQHHLASTPARAAPAPEPPSTFIPLALPAPAVEGEIQIELQRAGTTIKIVWPASAARDCAAWLRKWLR